MEQDTSKEEKRFHRCRTQLLGELAAYAPVVALPDRTHPVAMHVAAASDTNE